MESIIQSIATLFWAITFCLFFGPLIIIVSLIGKAQLGFINIDLSSQSKLSRFILALLGAFIWFAVYLPLINYLDKVGGGILPGSLTSTPTMITTSTLLPNATDAVTFTPTSLSTVKISTEVVQQNEGISVIPTFSLNTSDELSLEEPTNPSATSTQSVNIKDILISEVLANPCGNDSRNEYIEIYNSGNTPIDVNGLWFTDGDEAEKIVSWHSRYENIKIGFLTKIETTIIPPHGYAVILAPGYPFVEKEGYVMPYVFPESTVILTVEKGQLLGDEKRGIEFYNRDIIVLYQGDEFVVDNVVSTYGSPILSSSPTNIKDDGKDSIPLFSENIHTCDSVERINPINEDVESNWRIISSYSPGEGKYR